MLAVPCTRYSNSMQSYVPKASKFPNAKPLSQPGLHRYEIARDKLKFFIQGVIETEGRWLNGY